MPAVILLLTTLKDMRCQHFDFQILKKRVIVSSSSSSDSSEDSELDDEEFKRMFKEKYKQKYKRKYEVDLVKKNAGNILHDRAMNGLKKLSLESVFPTY